MSVSKSGRMFAVVAMLILLAGTMANADFVISYAGGIVRLVDDTSAALGSYTNLGTGVTVNGLAPLADGNFGVAYENSGGNNYARIFNGATAAAGNFASLSGSDISNIAGLANGNFVISYGGGIVRLVNGTTGALGSFANLGSGVTVKGLTPLANGNFAATYEDSVGNNYARIFDGATAAAGKFAPLGAMDITNIAGLANGNFVITYGDGIVRLVDGTSVALGSYTDLGDGPIVHGLTPLANGDFAAAYEDSAGNNYARIFNGMTAAPGVFASLGAVDITNIAGLANGDFAISYAGYVRLVDGESAALGSYTNVGTDIDGLAGDLVVPEPVTVSLLALGGLWTLVRRRR